MTPAEQATRQATHTKGQLPAWLHQVQRLNDDYNKQLLGKRLVNACIAYWQQCQRTRRCTCGCTAMRPVSGTDALLAGPSATGGVG